MDTLWHKFTKPIIINFTKLQILFKKIKYFKL